MHYFCPNKNLSFTVSPSDKIGEGGEGIIFAANQIPGFVAKILHKPTLEQRRKLEAMLAIQCASSGRPPMAWPQGLIFTNTGRKSFSGYLMPKVSGTRPILDFYHPKTRRQQCPRFNYRYLHRAALNVADCVCFAHKQGHVIGDLNESNFLVADNACVTMVDTDSWQIKDPATKQIFRCTVGKPDFIPPELQGKHLGSVIRTEFHDRFALAVLLFKLLMEGQSPFDGVFQGRGEVPPIDARIAAGHFPHGTRKVPWKPKPMALPFGILSPQIRDLFAHCFEDGHFNPRLRPDAKTWHTAITNSENSLTVCAYNDQHWFGKHLKQCPWCERTSLMKIDPFPATANRRSMTPTRQISPVISNKTQTTAGTSPQSPDQIPFFALIIIFLSILLIVSLLKFVVQNIAINH